MTYFRYFCKTVFFTEFGKYNSDNTGFEQKMDFLPFPALIFKMVDILDELLQLYFILAYYLRYKRESVKNILRSALDLAGYLSGLDIVGGIFV